MKKDYIYNDAAGIHDEESFQAVRIAVNKGLLIPQKDRISVDRARREKTLSLGFNRHPVRSLQFLDFFPNLQNLSVLSDHLPDFGSISQLHELRYFHLENAAIDSLAPLAECRKLEHLVVRNVHVADGNFSVIGQLHNLKILSLELCELGSISWISTLERLEDLGLDGSRVDSLLPATTLPRLELISTDETIYARPFTEITG